MIYKALIDCLALNTLISVNRLVKHPLKTRFHSVINLNVLSQVLIHFNFIQLILIHHNRLSANILPMHCTLPLLFIQNMTKTLTHQFCSQLERVIYKNYRTISVHLVCTQLLNSLWENSLNSGVLKLQISNLGAKFLIYSVYQITP